MEQLAWERRCIATVVVVTALAISALAVPISVAECVEPFCARISSSLVQAVTDHRSPGIAAAVVNETHVLYRGYIGQYTFDSAASQINAETLFDFASCTKVAAATTALAILYQRGYVSLDDRVSSLHLLGPDFATHGKGNITVRNLLLHNAGFPPDPIPGYGDKAFPCPNNRHYHPGQDISCEGTIFHHLLFSQWLDRAPGTKYVYSDLSMITLMFVIGKVVQSHALVAPQVFPESCPDPASLICQYHAFLQREVFAAVGMDNASFIPNNTMLCAPQWEDAAYRHSMIAGFVSDENAYALGGISGHAGLFLTLTDAIKLMKVWMFQRAPQLLNETTVHIFTQVGNLSQSTRALGWDTNHNFPGDDFHSCGTLSQSTFLHLGYTERRSVPIRKTRCSLFSSRRATPTRTT